MKSDGAFAHSPPPGRPDTWHRLDVHLLNVAAATGRHADKFGANRHGWWAGLLHDLGKFRPEFQRYLRACHEASVRGGAPPPRGSAPHSIHGAALARSAYRTVHALPADKARGYELAWVILNHHGGLRDRVTAQERMNGGLTDPGVVETISQAVSEFPEFRRFAAEVPPVPAFDSALGREFFIRMLLSALVDADHTDTEAWMAPNRFAGRRTVFTPVEGLRDAVLESQRSLIERAAETPVNLARREIYEAAMRRAVDVPGFFKLTVPTGGGKTLTGLAFALAHAAAHGLDRVVVAIPYTSITEQTAAVYRDVLGADCVLEHHSSANVADDEGDPYPWQKLASENWNAPVVVTTTVQLFESLFGNRTSKIRKLHNLARCVIVLDEVQTLPTRLLNPILDVLGELTSERYGSSVVLCTATPPALDETLGFPRLGGLRELVPEPGEYFRRLERVRYDVSVDRTWTRTDVAAEMLDTHQALCIVNLKSHARELVKALGDPEALHLSTAMCGAHRKQVLNEIRTRLKSGAPCRVVSTQLIEAGVDVDFPVVLRALGPLDSIVQAAGRCNREGKRDRGRVLVFKPEDHRLPPGYYQVAAREAESLLANEIDLGAPDVFEEYFRNLYLNLVERDALGIQAARKNFDYETVAARFQIIGDDTEPAIVRTWDEAAVDEAMETGLDGRAMRALQPYMINLYKGQVPRLERDGLIQHASGQIEGVWVWAGKYDPRFGIVEQFDTFVV